MKIESESICHHFTNKFNKLGLCQYSYDHQYAAQTLICHFIFRSAACTTWNRIDNSQGNRWFKLKLQRSVCTMGRKAPGDTFYTFLRGAAMHVVKFARRPTATKILQKLHGQPWQLKENSVWSAKYVSRYFSKLRQSTNCDNFELYFNPPWMMKCVLFHNFFPKSLKNTEKVFYIAQYTSFQRLQKSDNGQNFYWSSQTCSRTSRLAG